MSDRAPEAIVTDTAFRNQAVDVRIPLEITPKGMEDHDKAGSEIFRCIHFEEHTRNNTGDRMKETVKKGTIFEKEISEMIINGKDTVTVLDIDELKGHTGSAFHGILVSAGRAETAVASEWDKFKLAAMGTTVHGTAKRWITTVDHLIDIFHLSRSRMKCIFNFFIVVSKDSL